MYDVIVAGGGIAGASAAYFLGRCGVRVLVIEKQSLPRYKACGGGVPYAAYAPFPFSFAPVIECDVTAVTFCYADKRVTNHLPQPVSMVMRERLDQWVLEHAQADVLTGDAVHSVRQDEHGVVVTTRSGRAFRASYLIGADGAASRVARDLGLRRGKRIGVALEAEVDVAPATLDEYRARALFSFGCVQNGYAWVFPKAAHLSVGICALARSGEDLTALLMREMRSRGIVVPPAAMHAHPIPLVGPTEPLHTARALLVGDAAGLVDPLSGEGVRHAIRTAQLAAEHIVSGDLPGYTRRVDRSIRADLRLAALWARLFYRRSYACFRLGARNPLVLRHLLGILGGRATYGALFWRLPLYLLGLGSRPAPVSPRPRVGG